MKCNIRRTQEEVLGWYQEHLSGVSLIELSEKYKTDARYQFKKLGLKSIDVIPLRRNNRKELLYDFSLVTNDTEAYMLGLIFSDGSISDNVLKLSLQKSDGYLLEQIRLYICSEADLKHDRNNIVLRVCSKRICDNLRALGKTDLKLEHDGTLPKIDTNLMPSFIRGYFDGDGSIFYDKKYLRFNICSTNPLLLENFSKVLRSYSISSSVNEEKRYGKILKVPSGEVVKNAKNMYRLFVRQSKSLVLLYKLLYKNADIFLIRKKELFGKYVNTELTQKIA